MQTRSIIALVVIGLASLCAVGIVSYGLGTRNTISDIIGSGDHLVLDAIELEYERTLRSLVSDLGRARDEIAGGQADVRELHAILERRTRERDAYRVELEAYRHAAELAFDSRDGGYRILRAIGDELRLRVTGSD